MARVAGVDLPKNKRIDVALRYLYGIGRATSDRVLKQLNGAIKADTRVKDLTDAEIGRYEGVRFIVIEASSGRRSPFFRLQGAHAVTTFSQTESPPRERGRTWSSVRCLRPGIAPQYWQVSRSRMKTPRREHGIGRLPRLMLT